MGSNPVQAFFRPYFHYCSRSFHYWEDHFHIHIFIYSLNMWLSYIHSSFSRHSCLGHYRSCWAARFYVLHFKHFMLFGTLFHLELYLIGCQLEQFGAHHYMYLKMYLKYKPLTSFSLFIPTQYHLTADIEIHMAMWLIAVHINERFLVCACPCTWINWVKMWIDIRPVYSELM